jgi:hypothetical protein
MLFMASKNARMRSAGFATDNEMKHRDLTELGVSVIESTV